MKANLAAGLLMCRVSDGQLQYFLVHPGGPYFRKKNLGFWSIPKGIPENDETLLTTARREFFEETGIESTPPFFDLGMIKQKGRKTVHAWTFAGQWDPAKGITCNNFSLEWPPRSGKRVDFPEVDKAMWMDYEHATKAIIPEQKPLLDRAIEYFDLPV